MFYTSKNFLGTHSPDTLPPPPQTALEEQITPLQKKWTEGSGDTAQW